MAWVSGLRVLGSELPSRLHQVLICGTIVLLQLHQFWDFIWSELAHKSSYTTSIGAMRMRLLELQDNNNEAKNLRSERQQLLESWKDIEQVLYYQSFPYILKVICSELISKHHNNSLADHCGIRKTWELIAKKYYWPTLQRDVEAYVKGCNVCLALKEVRHKFYVDFESLCMPTHWWNNLSIDFVKDLLILAD